MNAILDDILSTATVTNGTRAISVQHPEYPSRVSHIDAATGALLQRAVREVQPALSLEIGLAYGVSTMFICEAIQQLPRPGRHLVMDPYQHGKWRGIGLKNVMDAGFGSIIDFRAEPSEILLPRLVEQGVQVDLAFIDGLHRFDQVNLEFFYVNRLLRPGGIVLFDDAARRSVNRAIRHALTYPAYEVYATTEEAPRRRTAGGRLRAAIGRTALGQRLLRRDVLQKDWDLNVLGRCVALRKVSNDERATHWDSDF
jgi:predicted O-methyltransferase YrrM